MLLLNLRVTFFRLAHQLHTILYYYPRFLFTDLKLAFHYLSKSPYHFTHDYGETPLRTLDRMAMEFSLLSKHKVIELGCGTGRTCLWLQRFVGCATVGVDTCSPFIEKAKKVSSSVEFRQEDILTTDLNADFLYFYGTSFPDDFIEALARRCTNQKVITVSFPLSDYDERFKVSKQIKGSFPWGKTEIFLNYIADAQDPVPCAESEPRSHSNS